MAVNTRLGVNATKRGNEHQNEGENRCHHGTRRLGSHCQRLTATLILCLLVHSLDDKRIDHQLSSALAGVENHSQNEGTLVIGDDEAVEAERNAHEDRIEHEVGHTLVLQDREGIRDVAKHKLDGKQQTERTLKLHGI